MVDFLGSDFDPTKYEFDDKPTDLMGVAGDQDVIAVVRTSDRASFRRCRRRWSWGSHLRGNLGPRTHADPLWLGSGIHFGLEDLHGYRRFPSAEDAFLGFVNAFKAYSPAKVPLSVKELTALGCGMLRYYERYWLQSRDPLQTLWIDGVPQVEVNFRIELPWDRGRFGIDKVIYSGTIDRIVIDHHGMLWIVEYKSAKTIQNLHLALDAQVSNYCWATSVLHPSYEIAGVIYQQHLKDLAEPPPILADGTISARDDQRTTHRLYRSSLINLYGTVERAPLPNIRFLNQLASYENADRDIYVRRDKARRNKHQMQAEGEKILMEIDEMLNPDTPLYPTPTRDCVYMCPFHGPCESIDDGSDWEYELELSFEQRDPEYDSWRKALVYPSAGIRS